MAPRAGADGSAAVERSTRQQAWGAVAFAAVTAAVAALGSIATSRGQDWYEQLDRPPFTPPDAIFGIVWTILYVIVALAGWLAWRAQRDALAPTTWSIQIGLNLAWTWAFFGAESTIAGLVVVVALLVASTVATVVHWRISRLAGALFVPYTGWVAFALLLNASIVVLERK